jgi:hypothetical protein
MKKSTLLFAISTTIFLFTSCKKESASLDNFDKPESWYEARFESAIKSQPALSSDQPATQISGVKFETYKDAYLAFKNLASKQAVTDTMMLTYKPKSTKVSTDNTYSNIDWIENNITYQYTCHIPLNSIA